MPDTEPLPTLLVSGMSTEMPEPVGAPLMWVAPEPEPSPLAEPEEGVVLDASEEEAPVPPLRDVLALALAGALPRPVPLALPRPAAVPVVPAA